LEYLHLNILTMCWWDLLHYFSRTQTITDTRNSTDQQSY